MDGEVLALMKKHGTYYIPTISAGMFVAEKAKQKGYYPQIIVPKALEIGPRLLNTFTTAYKFGIKIAFGTDSGVSYHGDNAKEFFYMVKGGMSEMEAIRSATAGDDMLRWDGIKAMVDGSLGSRTAWMHNHYLDDNNTRGVLIINDTTFFKDLIKNIDNNDVQLAVHAIGDKANDWIIDHFLQIIEHNGIKDRRFRIEHAQHLTNNGIDKIIKHDIIPSMQPYGCIDDTRWMHKRITNDLMSRSYIFNTFIQNNVNLTFGSDWDVTPLNPLEGIYAAVSRKTLNGKYPGVFY